MALYKKEMKITLTQDEQEQLLQAALRGDEELIPDRVASILRGAKIFSLEEAAAYYLFLKELL